MLIHGTSVALPTGKVWRAVLLRGQSGSGKSDLALRLIDGGGRLVADDQTRLVRKGRTLVCTAPPSLASLIEVRGLGIVKLGRHRVSAGAPLALLVDLVPASEVERLPAPATELFLGVVVPCLALAPFEASAPAKVRLALAGIAAS